jgi:DNA-binding response OmpR family regulator
MGAEVRWKVAVVNDDPDFLQLVNDVLEAEGPFEVFPFRDEETSLGELRAVRPDLLVVDILLEQLPSGWELALLAGADRELGPIPIIVVSPAVAALGRRVRELREIANVRVLSKPFTLEELGHAVHDALSARRRPETGSLSVG